MVEVAQGWQAGALSTDERKVGDADKQASRASLCQGQGTLVSFLRQRRHRGRRPDFRCRFTLARNHLQ